MIDWNIVVLGVVVGIGAIMLIDICTWLHRR